MRNVTKKLGRRPLENPLLFKCVGLTQDQWDWLASFNPGASPSVQFRELIEKSRKMWPRKQVVADYDIIDQSGLKQQRLLQVAL